MRKFATLGILLMAAVLGGCGNNATAVAPPAAGERGIFVSSGDCAATGKLTIDQCGDAIDQAVALDRTQAPSYRSLNGCVAAEGADRCSMSVDGVYRAQVQAFLVTMSKPPTAQPLYPSLDGSIGFRGIAKQAVNITDDSYTVSAAAQAIAHENAKLGK